MPAIFRNAAIFGVSPITIGDSITRSTVDTKYGASALSFAGVTGNYLELADEETLRFGAGDWTLEMWVKPTALPALSSGGSLISKRNPNGGLAGQWTLAFLTQNSLVPSLVDWTSGTTSTTSTFGAALAINTWSHIALSRNGANIRGYINGVQQLSITTTRNYDGTGFSLAIGRNTLSGASYFQGLIDDLRITRGVGRYAAAFTPPDELPIGALDPEWANVIMLMNGDLAQPVARAAFQPARQVAFAPTWPVGGKSVSISMLRRLNLGGRGRISGTVKTKGTPDFPTFARVRLMRDRDGLCVAEQWSNATSGVYQFDGFDENERYTVVAYDHTRNFRAVIADNLTPDLYL